VHFWFDIWFVNSSVALALTHLYIISSGSSIIVHHALHRLSFILIYMRHQLQNQVQDNFIDPVINSHGTLNGSLLNLYMCYPFHFFYLIMRDILVHTVDSVKHK
jgi:hypothetical protein